MFSERMSDWSGGRPDWAPTPSEIQSWEAPAGNVVINTRPALTFQHPGVYIIQKLIFFPK